MFDYYVWSKGLVSVNFLISAIVGMAIEAIFCFVYEMPSLHNKALFYIVIVLCKRGRPSSEIISRG